MYQKPRFALKGKRPRCHGYRRKHPRRFKDKSTQMEILLQGYNAAILLLKENDELKERIKVMIWEVREAQRNEHNTNVVVQDLLKKQRKATSRL